MANDGAGALKEWRSYAGVGRWQGVGIWGSYGGASARRMAILRSRDKYGTLAPEGLRRLTQHWAELIDDVEPCSCGTDARSGHADTCSRISPIRRDSAVNRWRFPGGHLHVKRGVNSARRCAS